MKVGGGKILLNRVTFPIPEKSLVGVIGPSGAGSRPARRADRHAPADTGTVLYDNRDLYRNYAELRYRIGLVPQESVLHTQLTARRALEYSAELASRPTPAQRARRRVDEVMGELGLTKHANTRADRLSGGQLKRVNVAQELLTKPSGCSWTSRPRAWTLAWTSRSWNRCGTWPRRPQVIVVTHSVANLDTCDRLLVLVPGGKIPYYGPPTRASPTSAWPAGPRCSRPSTYPDRDWAAEYAASQAHAQYVLGQRRSRWPRRARMTCPKR